MISEQDHYAEDVTTILLRQGMLVDDEAEQFRRYVRGW